MNRPDDPTTVARFQAREGDRVRCLLCPHHCSLKEGATGLCQVRRVEGGTLRSLVYGYPCAAGVDPIEKKPLFHFRPGSRTFSYATAGCNLACSFCQNHSISQEGARGRLVRYHAPEGLVDGAEEEGCRIIAHTYTEPTVYLEYALDIAREAAARGMDNVFVTNGFIAPEALAEAIPLLAAANVDLKSFSDETYRKVCRGALQPVLETIETLHRSGVWVEVTTLVIPDLNDSTRELGEIAAFIAGVSPAIPWHVSRFHPDFRMTDRGVTPAATLERAVAAGIDAGLEHIFVGNLPGSGHEDTRCSACRETVIRRSGFAVRENRLAGGRCPACGEAVAGVWDEA
jgi:pyruvate formate lyase activating enzyme